MLRNLDRAIIDEIQRAPQLLLAIKKSVGENRRNGRFLLTGSANLMTLPTVADSLAGRMETLLLLPLSQSEIEHRSVNWIDSVFAGKIPIPTPPVLGADLVGTVLRGGYPEAIARPAVNRRAVWSGQYIDSILQRDVRDVAEIVKLDQLPRLLKALALNATQVCNYSRLGGQLGIDGKTVSRYVSVFEQMYLLKRVDVWARNRFRRVVRSPKIQFIDCGLLCMLSDISNRDFQREKTDFGRFLEGFVFSELLKHSTVSADSYRLLYYRDADQFEVDVVIENGAEQLVGIEVKASATVRQKDLRGLKKLASRAGDQFSAGVLLYDGKDTMPVGSNLWAAPLSSLCLNSTLACRSEFTYHSVFPFSSAPAEFHITPCFTTRISVCWEALTKRSLNETL